MKILPKERCAAVPAMRTGDFFGTATATRAGGFFGVGTATATAHAGTTAATVMDDLGGLTGARLAAAGVGMGLLVVQPMVASSR